MRPRAPAIPRVAPVARVLTARRLRHLQEARAERRPRSLCEARTARRPRSLRGGAENATGARGGESTSGAKSARAEGDATCAGGGKWAGAAPASNATSAGGTACGNASAGVGVTNGGKEAAGGCGDPYPNDSSGGSTSSCGAGKSHGSADGVSGAIVVNQSMSAAGEDAGAAVGAEVSDDMFENAASSRSK